MKRLPVVIVLGLALFATVWTVHSHTRPNPAVVVVRDSVVPPATPATPVSAPAQAKTALDSPVVVVPIPVDVAPSFVESTIEDDSLFGPALFERPPTNAADQQRMLVGMLTRFDSADPRLLGVADAARDRARLVTLLGRIASGKSIPPDLLESMVRQLDQREQVVMERLARQYQLHVSRVFQRDAPQRTGRLEAWDKALNSWRQAGSPRSQRHELNSWLLTGIANSTPGSIEPLPTAPRFSFAPDLSSSAVAGPVAAGADRQPTAPAATPARVSSHSQGDQPGLWVEPRRAPGLAALMDRRLRSATLGDVSRESPHVVRALRGWHGMGDRDLSLPDRPNLAARRGAARPDATAPSARPDRQDRADVAHALRSVLPFRVGSASSLMRRQGESLPTVYSVAVDRLPTPVRHLGSLPADDCTERLKQPEAPAVVAGELMAENMAPSREPRVPAARPIRFARFTIPSTLGSAVATAGLSRKANSNASAVGLWWPEAGSVAIIPSNRAALTQRNALGAELPDEEPWAIPKVASSKRSPAVVAGAVAPSRQRHELEIHAPHQPLAWRPELPASDAVWEAWSAKPPRRRLAALTDLAVHSGAHDHRIARTVARLDRAVVANRSSRATSDGRDGLNRSEMAARIAGTNLTLRAMAAELDQSQQWNATRLASFVEQLQELCVRHADLTLYLQLMEEYERDLVGRLESPRSIVTRLGTRIYEARRRALDPQLSVGDRERNVELAALDALSRWLVELSVE